MRAAVPLGYASRMTCRALAVMLAVWSSTAALAAQSSWLPPGAEEQMARQLAARLAATQGRAPNSAEDLRKGTLGVVRAVVGRLDALTVKGVMANAPQYPSIELPVADDPHLAAMARYQLCNLVLLRQFEFGSDEKTRITGALGLTAVTLAVVSLMPPYLDAGGSVAQVEAFLTSAELGRVTNRLQDTPEALRDVERRCEPVITDLLRTAF